MFTLYLTYRLNTVFNGKFNSVCELEYKIYILENVEQEIEHMKDKTAQKKILQSLKRLSKTIPNNPEKWRSIKCKNKKNIGAYELKSKPYRLGCYKYGKYILVVHMWRVQKDISLQKRNDIEKACLIIEEVQDEFKGFVKRI